MPIPNMGQIRDLGDFATTYNWNLQFVTVPGPLAGQLGEGLNLRCSSTDVPKMTNTKMTTNIRGLKVHQPGISDPTSQLTLELNETIDNYVSNLIKTWRDLCFNARSGVQSSVNDVKADFLLQRLGPDRSTPIFTYNVLGAFLEDYDIPQLNGESDTLKPTMTLSYDYFLDGPGGNVV